MSSLKDQILSKIEDGHEVKIEPSFLVEERGWLLTKKNGNIELDNIRTALSPIRPLFFPQMNMIYSTDQRFEQEGKMWMFGPKVTLECKTEGIKEDELCKCKINFNLSSSPSQETNVHFSIKK
jgi:hypothetical protein